MVTLNEVEDQLKQIKVAFRFWGRPEMLELQHILIPGERIQACLNGRYEGGFAMLCATDQRLLLIDKKPLYLSLEDLRYDMVAEVDYTYQLIDATIRVCTPSKVLTFSSFRRQQLRALTSYIQERVIAIRQQSAPTSEQQFAQSLPQLQPEPTTSMQPAVAQAAGYYDPTQSVFPVLPGLPTPRFINPYTQTPLMMRRRINRYTPR